MALPKEGIPNGVILTGNEVGLALPENVLISYAQQLKAKIKESPLTMLPRSEKGLVISMQKGRSILCIDENTNKLLSYAEIWDYKDQHPEWQTSKWQESLEVGSWVSFMEGYGFGRRVLLEAPKLASSIDQSRQLVAIVEGQNERARQIVTGAGGVLIGYAQSDRIKMQFDKKILMVIYEIPKLT